MRFAATLFIAVSLLASYVVDAAPLPIPTVAASTSHADHATHASTNRVDSRTPVHQSARPQDGHSMGTMKASQHTLSEAQLHGHVAHIQAAVGPDHHVHATHEPGHDVLFHATPKHITNIHHAVHTAGTGIDEGLHATLDYKKKEDIFTGISVRLGDDDSKNYQPTLRVPGAPGTPQAHGRGITGIIPISPAVSQQGMTQAELQQHARWVNFNVARHLSGSTHVHVTHAPGDDHVKFHAIPPAGVDHLRARFQPDEGLDPKAKSALQKHLADAGTNHYSGGSITTGVGRTFAGTIPAHAKDRKMTPAELEEYARHARGELIRQQGITGEEVLG